MHIIHIDLSIRSSLALGSSFFHVYKNSYYFYTRTCMLICTISVDLMYLIVYDFILHDFCFIMFKTYRSTCFMKCILSDYASKRIYGSQVGKR